MVKSLVSICTPKLGARYFFNILLTHSKSQLSIPDAPIKVDRLLKVY